MATQREGWKGLSHCCNNRHITIEKKNYQEGREVCFEALRILFEKNRDAEGVELYQLISFAYQFLKFVCKHEPKCGDEHIY